MPPYNVPEPDIAVTAEPEGDGLIPLALGIDRRGRGFDVAQ
jgi:hypothetical protein